MKSFARLVGALTLATFCAASPAGAALDAADASWDGSQPPTGIFFHWYEPSFYTGFAPRTQDPTRVHIELSRGNQVRMTMVLGDAEIDAYAGDLDARRRLIQELIDAKVLELTTNREWERFTAALDAQGITALAASRGDAAARAKVLDAMSALNPGRVFRIRVPVASVATKWHAVLGALDETSATGKLDAANAVLPGRIALTSLSPQVDSALVHAAAVARQSKADSGEFRAEVESFVQAASGGHYRVQGGDVTASEFTAIYPAGTLEGTITYKGEKLPDFGVTGIWSLMKRENGRGQTGMVDYLSKNPGYGFIPLLAYQYAGGISYNAFHNAGVRCQLNNTPFLPREWRQTTSERDGKPFQNLWIVGRGPTSHGCTRLPSGHMSEMRHMLPTDSEKLTKVITYRNLPQCYDVFDLAADGHPKAMGVQYYLAYKSNEHTPVKASASNRREPFYRWLYGSNIEIGPVGSAKLKEVPVCRFVGKKAQEAAVLRDVALHEADFTAEAIQFYKLKPASFESDAGFHFNREIRKVGAGHTTDRKMLFLK